MMTLLAACASSSSDDATRTVVPPDRAEEKCSVVGSIPYWAQEEAIESLRENLDRIDYISVFWYHVTPKGKIRRYRRAKESAALLRLARQHDIKVLGLIANLPDDEREGEDLDWDPKRIRRVIGTKKHRAAHIRDVVKLARRMHFDGILIDYEALPGDLRDELTAFIRDLGTALRSEGKILAVAIHPKTSEDNPREDNGSRAQDWIALAQYADQLHFMTYSQHVENEPGPAAEPAWVERVLRYAVKSRHLPRAKIYFGMPLYAKQWSARKKGRYRGLERDLTFKDVMRLKRKHHGTVHWSEERGAPFLTYRNRRGRKQVIWFENRQSSAMKLRVATSFGICNLALWRLGGEDSSFWDVLQKLGWGGGGDSGNGGAGEVTESAGSETEQESAEQSEAVLDDGSIGDEDTGAGWPYVSLQGEIGAELEYNTWFATTDPLYDRDNWISNLLLEQSMQITDHLSLTSDVRVVLESDGENPRIYSDFRHEGIYLRSLLLQYQRGRYSVFAGKYEPAAGLRTRKPIFFGNFSTRLTLEGRLGAGASVSLDSSRLGRHRLTAHWFMRDTTRLRGEILTDKPRDYDIYGDGELGLPNSYLVTLDGGTADEEGFSLGYSLGAGLQTRSEDYRVEQMYFGLVYGSIPVVGEHQLVVSLEPMYLRNALGFPENRKSVGAGLTYEGPGFSLGTAYSIQQVDFMDGTHRTDWVAEVVGRYAITESLVTEAAYQHIRAWGESENAFGIVVKYFVNWQLN